MQFMILESVPWAGIRWLELTIICTLTAISVLSSLTIIEKHIRIYKSRKSSKLFARQIEELLKQRDLVSARRISKQYSKESHLAKILLTGLQEWESLQANSASSQMARHLQQAMEREVLGLQYEYERGLGLLDALGRTSPFIGALGGSAFTFAFGIIVAIPTIWFATNLRTKAALLLPIEMKISASQLTTYMEKINDTFYEKP